MRLFTSEKIRGVEEMVGRAIQSTGSPDTKIAAAQTYALLAIADAFYNVAEALRGEHPSEHSEKA